jgi:glycerol-3-phosphate O-acyltransferase/dihydroxyacetone phosphate acyltransferase
MGGTAAYRLIRSLVRLLLWIFYRRIDVVGRERIPGTGPLIIAANHHSALVDAMILMAIVPRPITVLAKAPLFSHPLIGPFLRVMGAVPVNRRLESGVDPGKNDAMFAAATAVLRTGGVMLIFPEGTSQPRPTLLPLRTGAARMLLAAEDRPPGPCGVTLLPVGMVFHAPGTFRDASVDVTVGDPVTTADVIAAYRQGPEDAVRRLTARLGEAIRACLVEADDHYTLALVDTLESAWWDDEAPAGDRRAERLAWKQAVMRGARYLGEHDPHRVAELRHRIERYRLHLDEAGITGAQIGQPYTAAIVARYVASRLAWLGLGLPLAVWGIVAHALPYVVTDLAVRRLIETEEEEATDKIAAGVVLYPVFWAIEGWIVWRIFGRGGLAVFVVLLAPSALLALAWRERFAEFARQARAFLRFLTDPDLHPRLRDERAALVAELRALAERVPSAPPVRHGDR